MLGLVRRLPLLGAVSRVARRAVRRQVSQERLHDAQIEVLRTVEAHPGIGTRAVAERLQLVPNTVSTLVGDLVRAGLLRRARDRSDRRAERLYLTEEAVARLQDWVAAGDEVLWSAGAARPVAEPGGPRSPRAIAESGRATSSRSRP